MVAAEVDGEAPEVAKRALLEQRLIINATGPTTLRFLPPLIVTAGEIDEALGPAARSAFLTALVWRASGGGINSDELKIRGVMLVGVATSESRLRRSRNCPSRPSEAAGPGADRAGAGPGADGAGADPGADRPGAGPVPTVRCRSAVAAGADGPRRRSRADRPRRRAAAGGSSGGSSASRAAARRPAAASPASSGGGSSSSGGGSSGGGVVGGSHRRRRRSSAGSSSRRPARRRVRGERRVPAAAPPRAPRDDPARRVRAAPAHDAPSSCPDGQGSGGATASCARPSTDTRRLPRRPLQRAAARARRCAPASGGPPRSRGGVARRLRDQRRRVVRLERTGLRRLRSLDEGRRLRAARRRPRRPRDGRRRRRRGSGRGDAAPAARSAGGEPRGARRDAGAGDGQRRRARRKDGGDASTCRPRRRRRASRDQPRRRRRPRPHDPADPARARCRRGRARPHAAPRRRPPVVGTATSAEPSRAPRWVPWHRSTMPARAGTTRARRATVPASGPTRRLRSRAAAARGVDPADAPEPHAPSLIACKSRSRRLARRHRVVISYARCRSRGCAICSRRRSSRAS